MTYRATMRELATTLALLMHETGVVPPEDTDVARVAHSSVITLLCTVHSDMLQPRPRLDHHDLELLERHPVSALGRVLARQPPTPQRALSDLLLEPPQSTPGLRWLHVAKQATVAQHEWLGGREAGLPVGDARWSEITDVAAVARAVAILSEDIAVSLWDAGRHAIARHFDHAAHKGLEIVAREVEAVARAGPLPVVPEGQAPPGEIRVLATFQVSELPDALRNLENLLRQGPPPAPAQLDHVLVLLVRTAHAMAHSVDEAGFSAIAATLRKHADRLSYVPPLARRLNPTLPAPQLVLNQARVINDLLNTHTRGRRRLPAPTCRNSADPLLRVSVAVADTVVQQVRAGRWLVPREGQRGPGIGVSRGAHEDPAAVASLRSAVDGSPLHAFASHPTAFTPPQSAPRDILAGAIARRAQLVARPPAPGNFRHPPNARPRPR